MDASWWLGLLGLAVVFTVPGSGFAARFARGRSTTLLELGLHAAWVSLAINWLNVAVVRELGIAESAQLSVLCGLAVVWAIAGWAVARSVDSVIPMGRNERLGVGLVALAVCALAGWKAVDLTRPLDGYWYLSGADSMAFDGVAPQPVSGAVTPISGSDAGGYRMGLSGAPVVLKAPDAATGELAIAMQGPVGSTLQVGSQSITVEQSVVEVPDEGAVRRYLDHGTVGLRLPIQAEKDSEITVAATGTELFVLPGSESVWAAHAEGSLRFVHYYQLLNQVENQVWAEEMLEDRWATLNQPPAWSPQLSTAILMLGNDMPAAGVLFLLTLMLVGGSAVRLAGAVAPNAPPVAFAVPATLLLSHGLLMIEPGSFNFPDSLYAAALLAVATAIAERRTGWIVALTIAAGLSRWPGVVVATILLLLHGKIVGGMQWEAFKRTWIWVAVGGLVAALGVASGVLKDLLFILYFETFPEHWHGDYRATKLGPRVPGFYALWTAYTGGGLLVALGAALGTTAGATRSALRWLVAGAGAYSLMLATIDHHPTHYFLPLVGLTGAMVVAASDAARHPAIRFGLPMLTIVGTAIFLVGGDVGLQPIEDMVESLDAALNP